MMTCGTSSKYVHDLVEIKDSNTVIHYGWYSQHRKIHVHRRNGPSPFQRVYLPPSDRLSVSVQATFISKHLKPLEKNDLFTINQESNYWANKVLEEEDMSSMVNYVMPKTASERLKVWTMQKLGLGSTEDRKLFTDKIYGWLQRFPSTFEQSSIKVVGTNNIFYSNQTVYPTLRKDDKQPKWTVFRDGALISKRMARGVQDEDLLLGEIVVDEVMSARGLDLFNIAAKDMIKLVAG